MQAPPCPIVTDVSLAASALAAGGLVAVPSETVYGLAAIASNDRAVARIFAAKQRPAFDPLIVHLPEVDWLKRVTEIPVSTASLVTKLAAAFWPGPLTLVLPKRTTVSDLVTSGLPGVAVRIPAHPLFRQVLLQVDEPLAAPSANLFGRLSPTTAQHVASQLANRIDLILDGGPCRVGMESTVLSLMGPQPRVLRPGGVTLEDLTAAIGTVELATTVGPMPDAPGQLPEHYAPRTQLVLHPNSWPADAPPLEHGPLGVLGFHQVPSGWCDRAESVEVLSRSGDMIEAAACLFAALHRLDARGLSQIVVGPVPDHGLGLAINDRLRRAAAGSGH